MNKSIMTKTRAKEWLPAVRKLLRWYQGEENECQYLCPLCSCKAKPKFGCTGCLWKLFDKTLCDSEEAVNGRKNRTQPWTRNAIKRLKRWEKRLLSIIEAK